MRLFDWLNPRKKVEVEVADYPEARRIAHSLREFPEDWAWKIKGYELLHVPTGFAMWVANKAYGLEEIISGGGKNKFSEHEQSIIWPAVEEWLARCKVGFTGRLPKVRIHWANGVWWCMAKGHPWAGAGISPADAYRSWSRAVSIQERKYETPDEPLQVWSRAL
ncbi:hypothetical protein ACDH60_10300 [Pseudomonas ficuserectae]|uniref:Uncharacterized protein n=1 Tax=Pseudomonas amygdali pv. lachrymans TaxID=53707 RepID=A0AB37R751_PSEAV|nr:hypothetical protein [Pseudomonas amygdali]ARA79611.1 hypothetical protein B5U27_05760 [Pseudomonas amygdali pv. lachrymans]KPC01805.1 Uncharacterized protein AC501_3088 [Pseudomonas amygdali pv. lachrymans]KPC19950.1 Uncharacterized protein AC499_2418 [Pseudomonas amygdali pv. lachrymans]QWA49162.1 hypothetical protein C4C37_21620 [Pseudomonas amygdali pv. lachrymans]RMM51560.1 hypothetical protein ALQ79_102092 [Pseudomonas amygdali pv. lachrymans]